MSNDLDSAVDRLSYAIKEEPTRRVSFLFGAGLSLPAVPSTADMVEIFCDQVGPYGSQLREAVRVLDPGAAYQRAAHELRQRRGEKGLAGAIRKGVLRARADSPSGTDSELDDDGWSLPPAQELLGKLISLIPSQQRGSLFTTNFDPLAEVALRKHGVPVATISTAAEPSFSLDSIYGALPVVHLHGYWLNSATLSTGDQLERPRPALENMLQRHLAQTIMVVVGYSGWDDSFTRALSAVVSDGRFAAIEGELLWMSYARQGGGSRLLSSILGAPGVNAYWEIGAVELMKGVCESLAEFRRQSRDSYPGWQAVPNPRELKVPSSDEVLHFTEGAQPSWEVVNAVPVLEAGHQVQEALDEALTTGLDQLLIISGPTGEGKSAALMQAALAARLKAESDVILFRTPTAPRISAEWIDHLRRSSQITVLFVDEADLIMSELFAAYAPGAGGRIICVLSIHSHYESILAKQSALASLPTQLIPFGDFTTSDAIELAKCWRRLDLLPKTYDDVHIADIATMIEESGRAEHGHSLFGAVLHLWVGDDLVDRVAHLMSRLEKASIRGRTLRQLLGAIALTQVAWNAESGTGAGLSLRVLGEMCELHTDEVLPFVVAPLGREVGIAQMGEFVFVRHPVIADAIVDIMRESAESSRMARMIGEAGARVRSDRTAPTTRWRPAYRLFDGLDGAEAFEAAIGAARCSPARLEPRVSLLAVARRAGRREWAEKYAHQLMEHVDEFVDRSRNIRGLYVERSMLEKASGHMNQALEYAVISLTDLDDAPLYVDQLRYGLVVAAQIADRLEGASPTAAALHASILDLLAYVPNAAHYHAKAHGHSVSCASLTEAVRRFRASYESFRGRTLAPGKWTFRRLLESLARTGVSPQRPSSVQA